MEDPKQEFKRLLALSETGWTLTGGPGDREAIWNPVSGEVLLVREVRWAHLSCVRLLVNPRFAIHDRVRVVSTSPDLRGVWGQQGKVAALPSEEEQRVYVVMFPKEGGFWCIPEADLELVEPSP